MPETIEQQPGSPFTSEEASVLKALARTPEKKWWWDYRFLIALCAFLLSLFTSLISAYVSHLRDVHDQQSRFTVALGALQDLNLKRVELLKQYRNTVYEGQVSELITTQVNDALHTAAELGLQLGTNASTTDLVGLATRLYDTGESATAEKLLKFALGAAQNANDESLALRALGFYTIRMGRGSTALKTGEGYFERALDLDQKYDLADHPHLVAWIRSSAQIGWAGALAPTDCAAAQKHFGKGVKILAGAPKSVNFDRARAGAKQQWITGIGGVPGCRPDAGTPPLP